MPSAAIAGYQVVLGRTATDKRLQLGNMALEFSAVSGRQGLRAVHRWA